MTHGINLTWRLQRQKAVLGSETTDRGPPFDLGAACMRDFLQHAARLHVLLCVPQPPWHVCVFALNYGRCLLNGPVERTVTDDVNY